MKTEHDRLLELAARLTRPVIGIENRTPQEVFDIMADRIRYALRALTQEPTT